VLTTLCAAHLAEVEPLTDEQVLAAFEEGVRDQLRATAARLGMSVSVLLRLRFV